MAEIGIIASVLQVAGAGLKLSETLYRYADAVASADRRMKDIAKEVQLTSLVINELGRVFEQHETSNLMSDNAVKTADETVKECSAVFAELDEALKKSKKGTWGKLMLPFRESKIELLRSHIDKLKSTLNLLMQVLMHAQLIASRKLDREAEVAQREHIRILLQNKKESTKRYEESLRNYSMTTEDTMAEDKSLDFDQREEADMAVFASSIASTINTESLRTCYQHIKALLEDLDKLQNALADQQDDSSEHQQSLIGSYFRARSHLDTVLLGSSKGSANHTHSVNKSTIPKSDSESEVMNMKIQTSLTGSTLASVGTRSWRDIVHQSEDTADSVLSWSAIDVREAILEAQEEARREAREALAREAELKRQHKESIREGTLRTQVENTKLSLESQTDERRNQDDHQQERKERAGAEGNSSDWQRQREGLAPVSVQMEPRDTVDDQVQHKFITSSKSEKHPVETLPSTQVPSDLAGEDIYELLSSSSEQRDGLDENGIWVESARSAAHTQTASTEEEKLLIEVAGSKEQEEAAFWIPQATPDGRLFYFNTLTGVSTMELPLEAPSANGVKENKNEKRRVSPRPTADDEEQAGEARAGAMKNPDVSEWSEEEMANREEEIRAIEQSVSELNNFFQDAAQITSEQKQLAETQNNVSKTEPEPKTVERLPIKFKDAVGRRFTFPWHLCQTWKGIENLITQAFSHIDDLHNPVQNGQYELVGPGGMIISPADWEEFVRPGWSISMRMLGDSHVHNDSQLSIPSSPVLSEAQSPQPQVRFQMDRDEITPQERLERLYAARKRKESLGTDLVSVQKHRMHERTRFEDEIPDPVGSSAIVKLKRERKPSQKKRSRLAEGLGIIDQFTSSGLSIKAETDEVLKTALRSACTADELRDYSLVIGFVNPSKPGKVVHKEMGPKDQPLILFRKLLEEGGKPKLIYEGRRGKKTFVHGSRASNHDTDDMTASWESGKSSRAEDQSRRKRISTQHNARALSVSNIDEEDMSSSLEWARSEKSRAGREKRRREVKRGKPTSPVYSPSSSGYLPTRPSLKTSAQDTAYVPTSPAYSPTSPDAATSVPHVADHQSDSSYLSGNDDVPSPRNQAERIKRSYTTASMESDEHAQRLKDAEEELAFVNGILDSMPKGTEAWKKLSARQTAVELKMIRLKSDNLLHMARQQSMKVEENAKHLDNLQTKAELGNDELVRYQPGRLRRIGSPHDASTIAVNHDASDEEFEALKGLMASRKADQQENISFVGSTASYTPVPTTPDMSAEERRRLIMETKEKRDKVDRQRGNHIEETEYPEIRHRARFALDRDSSVGTRSSLSPEVSVKPAPRQSPAHSAHTPKGLPEYAASVTGSMAGSDGGVRLDGQLRRVGFEEDMKKGRRSKLTTITPVSSKGPKNMRHPMAVEEEQERDDDSTITADPMLQPARSRTVDYSEYTEWQTRMEGRSMPTRLEGQSMPTKLVPRSNTIPKEKESKPSATSRDQSEHVLTSLEDGRSVSRSRRDDEQRERFTEDARKLPTRQNNLEPNKSASQTPSQVSTTQPDRSKIRTPNDIIRDRLERDARRQLENLPAQNSDRVSSTQSVRSAFRTPQDVMRERRERDARRGVTSTITVQQSAKPQSGPKFEGFAAAASQASATPIAYEGTPTVYRDDSKETEDTEVDDLLREWTTL